MAALNVPAVIRLPASRMRCSASAAKRCTADPGPLQVPNSRRSRVCGAALYAAPRPGHEDAQMRGSCGRLAFEHQVEPAGALERVQFVAAADMDRSDENLRHGITPICTFDHLMTARLVARDVDFGEYDAFTLKQRLGHRAIRAPARGIDVDRGHYIRGRLFRVTFIWGYVPGRQPEQRPARRPAPRLLAIGRAHKYRQWLRTSAHRRPRPACGRQLLPCPAHGTRPEHCRRAAPSIVRPAAWSHAPA